MKRPDTVRTSLEIPKRLHRQLQEAAARRGCSARQLVLESIERVVAETAPSRPRRRLSLDPPIVPSTGKPINPTEAQLYGVFD